MLLLIDNYDSFTYNLVHHLGVLGATPEVVRNDALSVAEALAMQPTAIVLSPGPGTPQDAGICVDLIRQAPQDLPIFGVCLGHQAIGEAYGAEVERCHEVLHGKLSTVTHADSGIFAGLPQGFMATRYHSLSVAPASLPECLEATARSQSGVVMGISHRSRPVHGVQFHPESIASEHGAALMANFLRIAGIDPVLPETETTGAA
ncbi:MAG: aminodeoxychorismate/anthranilate synthase component II [Pseudomonadota bacterium]